MNDNKKVQNATVMLPPAKKSDIENIESLLGLQLPTELRAFLEKSDGGIMQNGKIIIYSSGEGIHQDETLQAANKDRSTKEPLLFFARESEEEFAFKRSDMSQSTPPVYLYEHEEGKLRKIADDFHSFLEWAEKLPPG